MVSKTIGEIMGKFVTPLGYYTGYFRTFLLDADGHLQVDALSLALPAGAATSAKQDTGNTDLAGIHTRVDAISLDASGHVQADVLSSSLPAGAATETSMGYAASSLQALEGYVTAFGPDAQGRVHVDVKASVLPTGAATSAKQDSQITDIQAVRDYDRFKQRNRYNSAIVSTQSATGNSGNIGINGPTAAANRLQVFTSIALLMTAGSITTLFVDIYSAGGDALVFRVGAPVLNTFYRVQHEIVVPPGYTIVTSALGVSTGTSYTLYLVGYDVEVS